ncbi:hypothetical protein HHK36_028575 [Tetracentron sinense]|uniref:Pectinesterase inhibitor domain-containing protein n=1 Tax=Tetracentron sinense TaxID=13715 RepID=A0A834YBM2_TETSI|nr:hypothetical protein HHK36_028575 [Tetracentron sinense]
MKLFFSLMFFSFCLLSFSHGAISVNLIRNTCKKASQSDPKLSFNFCVASLRRNPKSQTADLQELGVISMELAIANATSTSSSISKLLKNKKLDPFTSICLKDCLGLYLDAVPTLKDAIEDFKTRDFYVANVGVSSAMEASSTCEDGFKEKEGAVSPLKKEDRDFFQLNAIALAIINMFH